MTIPLERILLQLGRIAVCVGEPTITYLALVRRFNEAEARAALDGRVERRKAGHEVCAALDKSRRRLASPDQQLSLYVPMLQIGRLLVSDAIAGFATT